MPDFQPPKVVSGRPEEVFQRIESEDLFEPLEFTPKYVRHLWISNLISRVLARVVGQGPYGPVPIRCNAEGFLYVAGLGGGYTRNQTLLGAVPNAYGAAIPFAQTVGRIDITIFDNPVYFKRSRDGIIWDDEFEMFKDAMYSLDVSTREFNIMNKTAGAIARYQIVGYFGD